MRENRTCGSEGGEAQSLPYPYPVQHSTLNASINHQRQSAAGRPSHANHPPPKTSHQTTNYQLSFTNQPSTINYQLLIIHYSLFTIHYSLFTINY